MVTQTTFMFASNGTMTKTAVMLNDTRQSSYFEDKRQQKTFVVSFSVAI